MVGKRIKNVHFDRITRVCADVADVLDPGITIARYYYYYYYNVTRDTIKRIRASVYMIIITILYQAYNFQNKNTTGPGDNNSGKGMCVRHTSHRICNNNSLTRGNGVITTSAFLLVVACAYIKPVDFTTTVPSEERARARVFFSLHSCRGLSDESYLCLRRRPTTTIVFIAFILYSCRDIKQA